MIFPTYEQAYNAWLRRLLLEALRWTKGHKGKAAELLEVHRNTFARMLCQTELTDPQIMRALGIRSIGTGPRSTRRR